MPTLGVVVYSLQGMTRLSRCLESVQWADTVTVCPLDQKKGSVSTASSNAVAATRTDWVLSLWGDECVEVQLSESLQRFLRQDPEGIRPAYPIGIRSYLLGRWVEGSLWSPTPSLRLIRESRSYPAHWWDPQLPDSTGRGIVLPGWISDYSCSELAVGIERLNQISSLWAEWLQSDGRELGGTSLVTYPVRVLMGMLFMKGLLFQGMAGISLSALSAYGTMVGGMKWHESRRLGGG